MLQLDRLFEQTQTLFGITLTTEQLEQLKFVAEEMVRWHEERANLTAITDPDGVEIRHILDSISPLILDFPEDATVADVGTGGGFPGLVLKIVRPDIKLALVESVGKKTAFLEHITNALQMQDVIIVTDRAETVGRDENFREQFDIVIARALAHMPVLVEYLLPLCAVNGRCIAMKGSTALRELSEARAAIEAMGGKFSTMRTITLPGVEETHVLIVLHKIRNTPGAFPRRVGIPAKRPILPEM